MVGVVDANVGIVVDIDVVIELVVDLPVFVCYCVAIRVAVVGVVDDVVAIILVSSAASWFSSRHFLLLLLTSNIQQAIGVVVANSLIGLAITAVGTFALLTQRCFWATAFSAHFGVDIFVAVIFIAVVDMVGWGQCCGFDGGNDRNTLREKCQANIPDVVVCAALRE